MELKNALAVCLISFFSATLVLLIARGLDVRGTGSIEPQLQEIAKELTLIRQRISSGQANPTSEETASVAPELENGLIVYYLHSNERCPNCRTIEALAYKTVVDYFTDQLNDGTVAWKVVNYQKPEGKHFVTDYKVQVATVLLVEMKQGRPGQSKRLDTVWGLVGDEAAFTKYVKDEIDAMLPTSEADIPTDEIPVPDLPIPDAETKLPPVPEMENNLPPVPEESKPAVSASAAENR